MATYQNFSTSPPPIETKPPQRNFSMSSVPGRRPSDQSYTQPPVGPRQASISSSSTLTSPTDAVRYASTGSTNLDVYGKPSGWYRGFNYDVADIWTAAMERDVGKLTKCLKAGLNVNWCNFVRDDKVLGTGLRSIADVVASRNDVNSMRLLIDHQVDLTGAANVVFHKRYRIEGLHIYKKDGQRLSKEFWTSPLHRACRLGYTDMVRMLLDEGRIDPNITDSQRRNGLHVMAQSKKVDIAKVLLDSGIELNALDTAGVTPLSVAAMYGNLQLVKLYIEHGASLDIEDNIGETAAYNAAVGGHVEVLTDLVANGADIDVRSVAGSSAFFRAASSFRTEIMAILVKLGADVDTRDNNGCTALLRATLAENLPLMEVLLHLGADIDLADNDGWSPLFTAMMRNDEVLIRFLLTSGADITKPDPHGNTPLHQASILGSSIVARHILAVDPYRGVNLSQANTFGETPLMLACKYNQSAIAKLLIKHGASPHVVDPNGHRAIDRAMYWGSHSCMPPLLKSGVQIDTKAFLALQQGKADHPRSGHDMILVRIQSQAQVFRKPTATDAAHLQDVFVQTVTAEGLAKRAREKQGKPEPEPKQPSKPALPSWKNPYGQPLPSGKDTAQDAKKEEEEETPSPDPFEACIPKLPPSMIINNNILEAKMGRAATVAGVGYGAASLGLGIAGTVLGI